MPSPPRRRSSIKHPSPAGATVTEPKFVQDVRDRREINQLLDGIAHLDSTSHAPKAVLGYLRRHHYYLKRHALLAMLSAPLAFLVVKGAECLGMCLGWVPAELMACLY